MTTEDLRALTEQGPRVVMVARADMLKLLDELDTLRAARRPRHVRATLLAPWLAPVLAGALFGLWVAAHMARWVVL